MQTVRLGLSLVAGAVVAAAVAALGTVPTALLVSLGAVYAGAVWVTLRNSALVRSPDSWERSKWSGAAGGVTAGLGLVVAAALPAAVDLRFALGLLVVGACWLMVGVGVELATAPESDPDRERSLAEALDST